MKDFTFNTRIEYHLALQCLQNEAINKNSSNYLVPSAIPLVSRSRNILDNSWAIKIPEVRPEFKQTILPPIPFFQLEQVGKTELHDALNNSLRIIIQRKIYNEDELKTKIKNHIQDSLITNDEISWLNKDDSRQCFYIWFCCTKIYQIDCTNYNNFNITFDTPNSINGNYIYNNFRSPGIIIPATPQSCHENIISTLSILPIRKEIKLDLLNQARDLHLKAKKLESFSWLGVSIDEEWALKYLNDIFISENLYSYPINTNGQSIRKDLLILSFDITTREKERGKKSIISNLKKAWNQKLYRDNLNKSKRKAYQFVLTQDVQEKLDIIKIKREENLNRNQQLDRIIVTKNQIVEELIQTEFLRLTSNDNGNS